MFTEDTPTHMVTVGSAPVKILSPVLILNAKCRSVLGRATETKKMSDATDIKFLFDWLHKHKVVPSAQEVPNASGQFVHWFTATHAGAEYWTHAGYNLQTGGSSFPDVQFFMLTFHALRYILSFQAHSRLQLSDDRPWARIETVLTMMFAVVVLVFSTVNIIFVARIC
jgi:hypothetical protein